MVKQTERPAPRFHGGGNPSELVEEPLVGAAVVGTPRLKTALRVELVGEVDVRLAVQQVPKIYSRASQMHGVDLEVAPIQRAVRIIMINLAVAARIFCPLNRQRNAACGSEFVAGI